MKRKKTPSRFFMEIRFRFPRQFSGEIVALEQKFRVTNTAALMNLLLRSALVDKK